MSTAAPTKLSKDDKDRINKAIDDGFPDIQFGNRPATILNMLRFIEYSALTLSWEQHLRGYGNVDAVGAVTRDLLFDAACVSICKIYEKGQTGFNAESPFHKEQEQAFGFLVKSAEGYAELCDWMTACYPDQVKAELLSEDVVAFDHLAPEVRQFEVADWVSGALKPPTSLRFEEPNLTAQFGYADIGDPAFILNVPIEAIQFAHDFIRQYQAPVWHWAGTIPIPFDGFDMNDFRAFWQGLSAISLVHTVAAKLPTNSAASVHSGLANYLFDHAVPLVTKSELCGLIKQLTNQDESLIDKMTDYITHDPTLFSGEKKKASASYQPIFALDSNRLAISNFLVLQSAAEKSILCLLDIKERTYNRFSPKKEAEWVRRLSEVAVSNYGLKPLHFKCGNKSKGDVDLILLDEKSKFGIAFQFKCVLGAKRIKEREANETIKAYEQIKIALEMIDGDRKTAGPRMGLKKGVLEEYTLVPMVGLWETFLNGVAREPQVPLVTNLLIDYVLRKTDGDLEALWKVASLKTFLPIENKHFQVFDETLKSGNDKIVFKIKKTKQKQKWDPDKDIQF
jgi:hypothetical protein